MPRNTVKYPRGYTKKERDFCDYVCNNCRISLYVACMYVTYARKMLSEVGETNLLKGEIDTVLNQHFPDFRRFSTATRTKYRKVVKIYREFKGVAV